MQISGTAHAGPGVDEYVHSIPYSTCGTPTNSTGLLNPRDHYKGYICPADQGQQCVLTSNPNFGFTDFDNFGEALLIMLQVCAAGCAPVVLLRPAFPMAIIRHMLATSLR